MRKEVIEGYRLSPQQERLWLLSRGKDHAAYRAVCAVRVEGELDADALKQALRRAVDQNEILHTTFHLLPGITLPVQVIEDDWLLAVDDLDLTAVAAERQERELDDLFERMKRLPFDLEQGPLMRSTLVTLSPAEHVLLISLSALCADATTLKNLFVEVARAYDDLLADRERAEELIQYAVVSEWLNDLLESDESEAAREYWRKQPVADPPSLKLPFDSRAADASSFDPQRIALEVDRELACGVESLAERYATTSGIVLAACWYALLWRLTRESELVIGVAYDGRTDEEIEATLGPLAKHLPLGCEIEGGLPFAELLRRFKSSAEQAEKWQEAFTFAQADGPAADAPAASFFPLAFEFEARPGALTAGQVRFSLHRQYACTDRFKVKLHCVQSGDSLSTEFHYDAARLFADDIERLATEFHELLRSATRNAQAAIAELQVVGEVERRRLLVGLNDTDSDYANDKCIHELFERQAARTPRHIAVAFGDEEITYAELNARANQLARHLRGLGVGAEVLVGVCVERSLDMVVGLLGILKAGGGYVPLDPSYPQQRLAFMLADSRAPVLLTEARLAEALPEHGAKVVRLDADREVIASLSADAVVSTSSVDNLAYVIYTSGTTGTPKGVMISHRAICNRLLWMQSEFPIGESDRVLQKTPTSFDASVWEIFLPLITGARLVLALPGEHKDSGDLLKRVSVQGVTTLQLVPSMLNVMLQEPSFEAAACLRRMFCGGEALTYEMQERFFERLKQTELINLYGPTEASIDAACWPCRRGDEREVVPIGRPIGNMRIYLLDERYDPMPQGVPGELYIAGVGLARGYDHRPDLTAERFIPDPYSQEPGARLYRTGDVARYLSDGSVQYLGRADDQVKIRGFRIELGEIEAVLHKHPAVRKAVVVAKQDGVAGKRLVAYVALKDSRAESERAAVNELRDRVRDKLPEYMMPSSFVRLNTLPLLASGKVDRRALAMPDDSHLDNAKAQAAPRTPVEELMAQIWGQVLGAANVGIHDTFLDLGGHSLLATQLVSRMREAFRVELPLRLLFETPTIAELAETVEKKMKAGLVEVPPLAPAPRDGDLPLSFAQQRLWYLDQLEPDTALYNISTAVRIRGRLDVAALERCFTEIVRRHEILRTCFVTEDGRPKQVVSPSAAWELETLDLQDFPEPERTNRLKQQVIEESQRPFNLSRGQVFRARLLRLGGEEFALLLAMHHIVSDAWSIGVFINEIGVLYAAFSQGKPSPLPELPIQYADFAVWQREWLSGDVLDSHLSYWKQQLDGAHFLLELPTDKPRAAVQTLRGTSHPLMLPKSLSDDVRALGNREGVTLFMTLLAAFQVLLRYYSRQDDIVVGTDVANRNRAEVEGLIGFFINQLVLRGKLAGDMSFRELLAQVREATLGAYAHQDLPFEKLVSTLKPERSLKYSPLFQVKLVLQNAPGGEISIPGLTLTAIPDELTVAKLDLTCLLGEGPEGIGGIFEYNSDLFNASTIARMAGHFELILSQVTARPDLRLCDVEDMLVEEDRRRRTEEKKKIEASSLKMFKSLTVQKVSLSGEESVRTELLKPGQELPLVLRPNVDGLDLADWAAHNREQIEAQLIKHGAILFRGFNVTDVGRFERFASSLCADLFNENGEHNRDAVSDKVYTPVLYPADQHLLWHNENSFNHSWPRKIWFACLQPAERGGETPIVDSRKVFEMIAPEVREPFIKKGVMYVRNYGSGLGLDWRTVFRTSDKAAVEAACRKSLMDFEWVDGDRLRTRSVRPAAVAHPLTGQTVWFNQAQHWHLSCLAPQTRASLQVLFDEAALPRSCCYGDGSPIEDGVMEEILNVYRRLEVSFPWQRGDVLMLDNLLTSHGRNAFVGERKLLVSMGEMLSYDQVSSPALRASN